MIKIGGEEEKEQNKGEGAKEGTSPVNGSIYSKLLPSLLL